MWSELNEYKTHNQRTNVYGVAFNQKIDKIFCYLIFLKTAFSMHTKHTNLYSTAFKQKYLLIRYF